MKQEKDVQMNTPVVISNKQLIKELKRVNIPTSIVFVYGGRIYNKHNM